MGSGKRLGKRRYSDSDLEGLDDLEDGKLMMEEEEEEYLDGDYEEQEREEGEEEGEEVEEEDEEVEDDEASYEEEDQTGGGEDIENDIHKDAEMEDLEKEYTKLRNQEQDILKNLKRYKDEDLLKGQAVKNQKNLKRYKDEDLLKGQAVKNQKALWDKTLEFRFLLQKAYSSSNRLLQEPVRSSFCDADRKVSAAFADVITSSEKTLESLLELQEALLEKNPFISQSSNGNSGKHEKKNSKDCKNSDIECDEDWSKISEMHNRIALFRDKSVDKWQRKTQVTTGAAAVKGKLQAFNQNISEQVASYMRDPSRMLKQMQQSRSTVSVFGTVLEQLGNNKGKEAGPDGDPELLDDGEFYQQLLKEFFEAIDPTSSETTFYALKRLKNKKRKIVDRRASKSRKIRYNVHEKIVNFMASQPMNLPPMAPKLFENLFGLKTQRPLSAI